MIAMQGFFLQLVEGAWLTLQLSVSAFLLGIIVGLIGTFGKLSKRPVFYYTTHTITSIIRGVPELVVLLLVYYGGIALLTSIMGHYVALSAFVAGVIALSLIFGAYASETFRGAYLAIPASQIEAALAFGFTPIQGFRRIIWPQLWRHALPGIGNLWFVLLKDTALVSLLGVVELMRAAQNATATTEQPFTFYLAAAALYLILTSVSLLGLNYLKRRAAQHIAEA